jgi:membrane associated rhomboid family serine protease
MSQVEMHPFEAVLRMCAAAAPEAWHPERYARRSGVPLKQLNDILKQLWDRGLLEKAARHPEDGPGLRLSARGWEVLNDRHALRRLCAADGFVGAPAPRPGGGARDRRAEAALEPLRAARPAYVTWVLLGANVAVFLVGLALAYRAGVALTYLGGTKTLFVSALFLGMFVAFNVPAIARYLTGTLRMVILLVLMVVLYQGNLLVFPAAGAAADIRHQCGLLTASDWLHGAWWRALTACFVHLGLLHLLTNMMVLYNAGRFIESLWGPGRYLVIYLLAGVTGSLAGLAAAPGGIAGASGALCGLIAALTVWMIVNGGYLPERLRRELWNNLSMNLLLLVAIGFVPGVSNWGHGGGALAGAAAAVCLHYQRFGQPVWRWAALLGLLAIPLAGVYAVERTRDQLQKAAGSSEEAEFKRAYADKHRIDQPLTREMSAAFKDKVRTVLEKHPQRREDAEKEAALAVLAEQRKELESWREQLDRLGPYTDKDVEGWRQEALAAVKERLDLYARAEESLRAGEKFPEAEEKRIAETPELQRPEEKRRADARKHEETDEERQARARWEKAKEIEREEARFEKEFLPKISKPLRAAQRLYDAELADLLDRPPEERVPQTVKKNLPLIDERRKALGELTEWLPTIGPFKSGTLTKVVERSGEYAAELSKLLEATKRCLEAGDKWTNHDAAALKEQEKKVETARKAWQEFLQ